MYSATSVNAVVGTQDPQLALMVLIGVLAAIVAIAVPIVIPVLVFAALPTIVGIEFQRAVAALEIFILFGFAVPTLYTNDQVLRGENQVLFGISEGFASCTLKSGSSAYSETWGATPKSIDFAALFCVGSGGCLNEGDPTVNAALAETIRALGSVSVWPLYPSLYEINTWVWLSELSERYGTSVSLCSLPPAEWDAIAAYGFDAVWLMGVWERSPAGIAIASKNNGLLEDFRRALPDFRPEDNVGSPYCVRRYVVDPHLGGPEGLAVARRELARRGMNLVLDFVPNHVAPDHPWVTEHPEYFIRGAVGDLRKDPSSFVELSRTVFARGRDPYFPAWLDVLQLNAFHPGLRHAALQTISNIAQQCDGVRCDMAMLMLNPIFSRTWGGRAGPRPATEYWVNIISAIKKQFPGFLFIAEAYWELEWELQQQGFDFCYDKTLYDRMEHGSTESIRLHLCADMAYQGKLLRFIENHDEPRAAATFSPDKQRAIALTIATLPGTKLFHEGQFEGRNVRLPVFLARRPEEPTDYALSEFYNTLLKTVNRPVFREGKWSLCERTGWTDNASFQNLIAWNWVKDDQRCLIVVNLSEVRSQAKVQVRWPDVGGRKWTLNDVTSSTTYERDGDEMLSPGFYVELGPWHYHFFECVRTNQK